MYLLFHILLPLNLIKIYFTIKSMKYHYNTEYFLICDQNGKGNVNDIKSLELFKDYKLLKFLCKKAINSVL